MRLLALIVILCTLLVPLPTHAQTIRRCTEQALDNALDRAQDGDVLVFNCSGTITLTSTQVIRRSVTLDASGYDVTIDGGNAVRSFHIMPEATVVIQGLNFTRGSAESGGSAINNQGNLTLVNSTLRENVHAVANFGTMIVRDSTFADNNGVGIYNSGDLLVQGSTFTGNTHGIDNASGVVTVANSTFAHNHFLLRQGIGAGIANSGTVTVINSTFYSNTAPAGGGAVGTHRGGQVTLINSILANSGASGNCFGPMIDGGGNLQFPDSSCGDSIPVADPLLHELADNGGRTLTLALSEDSPAIGAADAESCAGEAVGGVDQRGAARFSDDDDACDIGAFEYGAHR